MYVSLEIEDEMCKKFFEKNRFMLVLVPVLYQMVK